MAAVLVVVLPILFISASLPDLLSRHSPISVSKYRIYIDILHMPSLTPIYDQDAGLPGTVD
jgi:hypothetical protein